MAWRMLLATSSNAIVTLVSVIKWRPITWRAISARPYDLGARDETVAALEGELVEVRKFAAAAAQEKVAAVVGPDRYCSPRHVISFDARNEGPQCGG
jgi:hypothetical protein